MEIANQIQHDIVKLLFDLSDVESLLSIKEQLQTAVISKQKQQQKAQEAALLQQLNTECVLPEKDWRRFQVLTQKRDVRSITQSEKEELAALLKAEEQLRIKRINILGTLSAIKQVPLLDLMQQLDLQTPS